MFFIIPSHPLYYPNIWILGRHRILDTLVVLVLEEDIQIAVDSLNMVESEMDILSASFVAG